MHNKFKTNINLSGFCMYNPMKTEGIIKKALSVNIDLKNETSNCQKGFIYASQKVCTL